MTTVTSGNTGSTVLAEGDQVLIAFDTAEEAVVLVQAPSGKAKFSGAITVTQVIGPFSVGDTLYVTAKRGSVDYTILPATPNPPSNLATRITQLTGDYTLTAADDNVIFYATLPVIVTVPVLATMPACIFITPGSGSVTLHPTGGTLLNGATADILRSRVTDPAGFALSPVYGDSNNYSVTSGSSTFATLSGNPTDNSLLATALAGKVDALVQPAKKMTANYTLNAGDIGRTFYTQAAATRQVIVPAGLPTNFWFDVQVRQGATSDITVNNGAGVSFVSVGNAYRLTQVGATGRVQCDGDQDSYFFSGTPYWVV